MVAEVANWLIWAAFAAEFAVVISLADNRGAYARKAWLYLLIIVVSFPVLPELLAFSRLVRLSRVLRMLRMFILIRGLSALGRLFRKRGFGYVSFVFVLVALATGALFALFEGHSLVDGLWWTVVTLTTVGYGDFSPATAGGRATAVVLMVTSIGVVSFITPTALAAAVLGYPLRPRCHQPHNLMPTQALTPSNRTDRHHLRVGYKLACQTAGDVPLELGMLLEVTFPTVTTS